MNQHVTSRLRWVWVGLCAGLTVAVGMAGCASSSGMAVVPPRALGRRGPATPSSGIGPATSGCQGTTGCACFGNGTCDIGYTCVNMLCYAATGTSYTASSSYVPPGTSYTAVASTSVGSGCTPGTQGCTCNAQGTCGVGLLCSNNTCLSEGGGTSTTPISSTGTSTTSPTSTTTATSTTGTASSGPTATGNTVTFKGGVASGAMVGYGFVAGGTSVAGGTGTALTTFTDPTCPAGSGTLTGGTGAGCAATSWTSAGDSSGLCMTGSIPAYTTCPTNCGATETGSDYSEDWGAEIGINAGTSPAATLTGSFTQLAVTFTGTPGGTVRLQVEAGGTAYCLSNYVSGTMTPASSLMATCYNTPPGAALASLSSVTKVELQITSAAAAETFSNFCMTGISFQ